MQPPWQASPVSKVLALLAAPPWAGLGGGAQLVVALVQERVEDCKRPNECWAGAAASKPRRVGGRLAPFGRLKLPIGSIPVLSQRQSPYVNTPIALIRCFSGHTAPRRCMESEPVVARGERRLLPAEGRAQHQEEQQGCRMEFSLRSLSLATKQKSCPQTNPHSGVVGWSKEERCHPAHLVDPPFLVDLGDLNFAWSHRL